MFSATLLAPDRGALGGRVDELTDSRSRLADDSSLALRRIERDLHDGPQARLASLGMSIGLAERLMKNDPEAAAALMADARASSAEALAELRQLVRGIHPPVLAERGLTSAVAALSLSLPIPVDVSATVDGRPAAPVEAAMYFAIAEALANVVKHSGSERAEVRMSYEEGRLIAVVQDFGVGGASLAQGHGLRGVQDRLAPFDGRLFLGSPPGGPTLITLEVPCELSSARIMPSSGTD